MIENEQELYGRIKKYGINNKDRLSEIYDIFANPFTNETFKKACDLIDLTVLGTLRESKLIQHANAYLSIIVTDSGISTVPDAAYEQADRVVLVSSSKTKSPSTTPFVVLAPHGALASEPS